MNGISKDTFEKADKSTQMLIIFDLMHDTNKLISDHVAKQEVACKNQSEECNKRFKNIESRRAVDTTIAAGTGLLGGFIGVLAKMKLWP